ncbi:MAG TPA: DNA polymerase/3'-5' exonuclease PolX [Phycisphaerae bacterium]|nr:DNA polymerase/3'-5' exonuclease PolX [Phycisphaerae bacterium]
MKNLEIASLFQRTADVLALLDGDSFRILAYRKIARVLSELPHAVEKLSPKELQSLPGIGKSSAQRIAEYLSTGKIAEFEDTLAQVPAGVLEMTHIPSLGPKTAALLWKDAGITTIDDLKARIDNGTLLHLPGLGEKKLKKIRANLDHVQTAAGRTRLGEALPLAQTLVDYLRQIPGVQKVAYCGSLRRGKETIGDIDIAVAADPQHAQAISDAVTKHTFAASTIQAGPSKTSILTGHGVQVDVRTVPPKSWGAALQYFTGSQHHNVKLRQLALKKGYTLNEFALSKINPDKSETPLPSETEEQIYNALGLAWIPPELREDTHEIEEAAKLFSIGNRQSTIGSPFDLVTIDHIRGDLHTHTTASDGSHSIEEMVAEAKRRGFEYLAITDHSKSQFQANGLKPDRLLDHIQKIHAVAKEAIKSGFLLLAGSEVDILADGSLDYEDDLLAKLDWVVASPHAALSQDSDAATARMVRVAANPYVCVIGHPTGRLIPSRRGIEPDMEKVIFAAARNGIALEINANTHRLDLRDTHARLAVNANVPICIDTDAHSFADFDELPCGILTARRAWATPAHILNTRPLESLQQWLKDRKATAGW